MWVAIILALSWSLLAAPGGAGDEAVARSSAAANDATQPSREPKFKKLHDDERLPNVIRLHEKVLSGGLPRGDEGFATLARLGVKTIISVDGAKPDVELARKHGLSYVHLPHGYDGVPDDRALELAKAVRELEGPVYIHCHHGKHRSPAAAVVACVSTGLMDPQDALGALESAGTSRHYRGLYASAVGARPIDGKKLDALQASFPEVAEAPPMVEAMVAIEHRHDHLKRLSGHGWSSLVDHPDIAAAHEALLLREHFTELARTDEGGRQPEEFRRLLAEGERRAFTLEELLGQADARPSAADVNRYDAALEAVTQNCTACHTRFRDVPLTEKPDR